MAIKIKPGIIVALKTSLRGGVKYTRVQLDDAGIVAGEGAAVKRWETTRVIEDRESFEAAQKCRSTSSGLVRKACAQTAFGLLCPLDREDDLDAAVALAKAQILASNDRDPRMRIDLYVLKGRIAETDEEANRAIAGEMRDLLDEMSVGISAGDASAIRDAANRARELSAVLEPTQQEKVAEAIEVARAAARALVKRVEKGGEKRELVVQSLVRGPIEAARFAFLDEEDGPGVAPANEMPSVDGSRFAGMEVG